MEITTKVNLLGDDRLTDKYLKDMLVLLSLPQIIACVSYGWRPLLMSVFSVAATLLADTIFSKMARNRTRSGMVYSIIVGWALSLLMPATAPYWLPIVGGLFVILVTKVPFGRIRNAPFAPIAVGYAFLSVAFKDMVYSYPLVNYTPPLFGAQETSASAVTIAKMLKTSSVSYYDTFDVLSGAVVGPMGATCFVLLAASLVYLLIRQSKAFVSSASFVVMCAVIAAIFKRVNGSVFESVLLELSSGSLMFFAVFAISFPYIMPETLLGRVAYGAFTGVLCMAMRHFGGYEEGACFAILIMNVVVRLGYTIKTFDFSVIKREKNDNERLNESNQKENQQI